MIKGIFRSASSLSEIRIGSASSLPRPIRTGELREIWRTCVPMMQAFSYFVRKFEKLGVGARVYVGGGQELVLNPALADAVVL